ncbi:MAG: acyl-CoA thioesterase [Lachnospiraceae bacterium]|nr:acyl-CoA thioesterase [Lachnospiraceae bacterium]
MYRHTVQYYETDKMGVTHHSNYIRWMEEARVDFLEKKGWPFARLEEEGIISPVLSVDCRYKKPSRFSDAVDIEVSVAEFNGVKLKIAYRMYIGDELICEGESGHCFVDDKGMPIRLKKSFPEFYGMLEEELNKQE